MNRKVISMKVSKGARLTKLARNFIEDVRLKWKDSFDAGTQSWHLLRMSLKRIRPSVAYYFGLENPTEKETLSLLRRLDYISQRKASHLSFSTNWILEVLCDVGIKNPDFIATAYKTLSNPTEDMTRVAIRWAKSPDVLLDIADHIPNEVYQRGVISIILLNHIDPLYVYDMSAKLVKKADPTIGLMYKMLAKCQTEKDHRQVYYALIRPFLYKKLAENLDADDKELQALHDFADHKRGL